MGRPTATVTSVDGNLICARCGSQWEDHRPFTDDETSSTEGCIQAIGRRLAELDVRTAGIDPVG